MPVRQAEAEPPEFILEKTHVERRIVGHQGTMAEKAVKLRQRLLGARLAAQHLVGDAVNLLCLPGDRVAGIDQAVEFPGNHPALPGHGTDFDDPIPRR